ncbi:MAG: Crp/Fnr family transcriptional regulator [Bacteroidota bacterium]
MDFSCIYYHFLKTSDISEKDFEIFKSLVTEKIYKKNAIILKQDTSKSFIYFIKGGSLMTYHETEKKTINILQFGQEGLWTGDIESMNLGLNSKFTIKAMTDSALIILDKAGFEKLLDEAPSFERYFRILFQNSMINHQKRIIQNSNFSAEQRYEKLLEDYPKCELIFPQKYIAAFLGITPEFFSKMKSKLYLK